MAASSFLPCSDHGRGGSVAFSIMQSASNPVSRTADRGRQAVLVLGMHRSGTSAVAGALHLLGVQPPKYMIPAATDNPSGFFEAFSVLGVNDWILHASDSTWYDSLRFDGDALDTRTRSIALALINFSLMADFQDALLLLLKDPRLCLLLDLWLPVLRASNIAPSALLVLRHPGDTVASLERRDSYPAALSLAMWLQHMLAAEFISRDLPRAFLAYDELLQDWRRVLSRAGRQAAIDWPRSLDAAEPQIRRFLDFGLRHHRQPGRGSAQPGTLAAFAIDAYQAMLAVGDDPADTQSRTRLDEIRVTFTDWKRRDGKSLAASLLQGHGIRTQPRMPVPAGWLQTAESLTKGIG
jgi:hypothetical protein